MHREATFSQDVVEQNEHSLCVLLRRNIDVMQERRGEIILDLNHSGNWVRGFEIVGGFVPFSVDKAVRPFNPVQPVSLNSDKSGTVTYDPEADAAFFYLQYAPWVASLSPSEQSQLESVSHSVNPTAIYGLDKSGGLVLVKIPLADVTGSTDQLLKLFRR
jgi:uncharacterized protein YuzE